MHSVEAVTAGIAFLGGWAGLGCYAIGLFACVMAVPILALLKQLDRCIDPRIDQFDAKK